MFRVAATYVFAAWVIVQVADAILPALRLPEWALPLVVYLMVLGFPVAMVLAWAFDVGSQGIVVTADDGQSQMSPRRVVALGLVTLGVTAGLFIVLQSSIAVVGAADPEVRVAAIQGSVPRSMAVLPFADLSPSGDHAWLGQGITEELLAILSMHSELHLAIGSDAHQFRTRDTDLRTVGAELSVATVLDGSVRRIGDRVRVSVRLLDVQSGFVIFSASYDGQLDDIFGMQTEVAEAIAVDLRQVYGFQAISLEADPSTDPEAALDE